MTTTVAAEPVNKPKFGANSIIAVAAFSCLVVTMLQSLVVPAVPEFPQLINTSPTAISWLVTSTLLVGAVATPILGRVSDIMPRRPLMVMTMGVVLIGSLVAPLGGIVTLIIGRALQGVGTALVPIAMAQMRSLPAERRPGALALLSATLGIGGGVGIPLGGVLLTGLGWEWMFYFSAIMSGLGTLALWIVMPNEESEQKRPFDYGGAMLLALALSALLIALSQGPEWGWGSVQIILLFIGAVVFTLAWGFFELKVDSPLVDLSSAAYRPILYTNLASILMGILMFTNLLLTTLELQNPAVERGFEWSASAAGLAMLPSAAVMFAVAPISARLSRLVGSRMLLVIGAAITGAGYVMRLFYISPTWTIIAATLLSVGIGIGYAAMPMIIVEHSPASEIGSANALNALMRAIGMALSSAMVAAVTGAMVVTVSGIEVPSSQALITLGIIGIVMSALSALLALVARPPAGAPTQVD